MAVFSRFLAYTRKFPVLRGMISYGTIWPTSCLIQQTIAGNEKYDYKEALRFSLYGSLFVAPTLYAWIRFSTFAFPGNSLRVAATKAFAEQLIYLPAALVCFFFFMTLLDGKGVEAAKEQVNQRFIPTYKVALCFYPFCQTINFCYIKERNRVAFVSVCSLISTCFLAYMHQAKQRDLPVTKETELLS